MKSNSFLSIGSNMGDREWYLKSAIKRLDNHPQIQVIKKSSIYETDPVGYTEQNLFLNMVVKIITDLSPFDLLSYILQIENEHGRKREIKWGPRTLDLDILLYNNENIETEQLFVPHPRMKERSFVLIPLFEIEPQLQLPHETKPLSVLIDQLKDKEGVRVWKQISGVEELGLLES